jgi:SAM-dependent methyltransferase
VSQYEEGYFFAGSYDDYLSERKGLEKTFERRLEKIEKLAAPGRVLDLGCAFGFFLSVAQGRGWDAYGVDLSPSACRHAREQLGVQVIDGTLRDVGFDDAFFDVVVMNDVFEHLPDPSAELVEVHRVLRAGGYLFIVTQDVSSAIVRVLGSRWAQYKPSEHLYYFTRATLRAMLEKSGFAVLRIESEGLLCTVKFLVGKLHNVNATLGRLAGYSAHGLRVQDVLVPLRPGYEIMAYARKE